MVNNSNPLERHQGVAKQTQPTRVTSGSGRTNSTHYSGIREWQNNPNPLEWHQGVAKQTQPTGVASQRGKESKPTVVASVSGKTNPTHWSGKTNPTTGVVSGSGTSSIVMHIWTSTRMCVPLNASKYWTCLQFPISSWVRWIVWYALASSCSWCYKVSSHHRQKVINFEKWMLQQFSNFHVPNCDRCCRFPVPYLVKGFIWIYFLLVSVTVKANSCRFQKGRLISSSLAIHVTFLSHEFADWKCSLLKM